MKTKLCDLMACKVPAICFALACLLLITVALGARHMTNGISTLIDKDVQWSGQPIPGTL